MTSASLGQVQVAGLAAAEHQHPQRQLPRRLEIAGVGDDVGNPAEPRGLGQVGVGGHQHGDRAEPRQRRDRDQRAGPGLHQDADVRALAHADLDEPADDVVDAAVHRLVGVHAAVEQQELAVGRRRGLLGHDPAERDAGVVVDLAEPGQPRQGAGGLDGQRARRLVGGDERVGRRAGQAERHLGGGGRAVRDPRCQRDAALAAARRAAAPSATTSSGMLAVAGEPLHPRGHRRPGLGGRLGPDDEAEMPCADEVFVDVGLRGGALDPAHRRRLADVVDLADDGEHGAVDVGERDEVTADGEAAAHHPVVGDELLEQLGDRRARPGDPAVGGEESPLLLARQQRFAVVQLAQEVQPRLRGLDRVEHLKAGARQPARDVDPAEHVVGHEVGGAGGQAGGQVHRQRGQGVDGRPNADDAGQVLGPPVRRGLVGRTCRPGSSRPGGRRGR